MKKGMFVWGVEYVFGINLYRLAIFILVHKLMKNAKKRPKPLFLVLIKVQM